MGLLGKCFCKICNANDQKKRFCCVPSRENVVKTVYDYRENANEYQKLNVYADSTLIGKRPVIIDVHGGGWYYGDKDLNEAFNTWFVKRGYTVIAIGYSLIDKTTCFVDQLNDVITALNWISANSERLNLDKNNLFAMGDSAGAHLLGLVLNLQNNSNMASLFTPLTPDIKFKAINYTCGAFDPSFMTKFPILHSFCKEIIGKGNRKSDVYKYFDVTSHLPDTYPPVHMVTAEGDFLRKMVLKTKNVFEKKGYDVSISCLTEKQVGKKLEHVFNVISPDNEISAIANVAIDEFFKKHLTSDI